MSSKSSDSQPLSGHVVVFTGKLSSLGRRDAFALVAQLGGSAADDINAKTTMLVIGAEGFGVVDRERARSSKESRRAERAVGGAYPDSVRNRVLHAGGRSATRELKRQYHATRDLLARYRALRDDHVRYLVKYGIVRPALRTNADTFFRFADVATLKQANDDLSAARSFRSVVRALTASRDGQLAFDFRHDAAPAKIITLRRPSEENGKRARRVGRGHP